MSTGQTQPVLTPQPTGYKTISTGYEPRPLQKKLHLAVKRFSVVVCHRRFGKTVFALNHMIDKGLRNPLVNPQYAYLAPTYGQAKRVAWDYLKQYTSNIPGAQPNEADLRVDIPRPQGDRIRYMLLGAENPMALKGIYLDGAIPDEYGEMNPSVWREVIRPILSDRLGWSLFLGTPKGQNNFYDLWNFAADSSNEDLKNWYRGMFKASETGIISPEELSSAKATMTDEEYEQEYECSFQAGMVGAYFSKEMALAEKEKRIGSVPYERQLPVETYWDLGINDVAAIWFIQKLGREFRVVDFLQEPDLSIPELIGQVQNKIRAQRCVVGQMYFPHDIQVREMGSGKSRIETVRSLGVRPRVVPRIQEKMDSINAAKMILGKCHFDAERCKFGLNSLRSYQRKWDSKSGVFSQKPLHNHASNAADAFQCFAMGVDDRPERDVRDLPRESDLNYEMYTHRGEE